MKRSKEPFESRADYALELVRDGWSFTRACHMACLDYNKILGLTVENKSLREARRLYLDREGKHHLLNVFMDQCAEFDSGCKVKVEQSADHVHSSSNQL